MAFAALNHVAVTVSDMAVSGPWYRDLIGEDPVLDEHTDAGYRHLVWALPGGTLFGIHQHDRAIEPGQFTLIQEGIQKQHPDQQRNQRRQAATDPGALAQG